MPGSIPYGFHEGGRSEQIAHPIFSAFGSAVQVPRSEDYGLDFYCTLMERQQHILSPIGYYAVQVKSDLDPWVFGTPRAVRWFVEYTLPIFFCVVTKSESRVRIYHTSPRFYVWSTPPPPERLELVPEDETEGTYTRWSGQAHFSLGAPVLDFRTDQLDTDEVFLARAAGILKFWIDVDEENLKRMRMGIREFKMPSHYRTNILPDAGTVIQGLTVVGSDDLKRAILHLKVPLNAVTDQLFRNGDLLGATRGMLLLRHLCWDDSHLPSALSHHALTLNGLMRQTPASYLFEAIDELGNLLDVQILESVTDSQLLARVSRVYLTGRQVTDRTIEPLSGAHELKWLYLGNTGISDDGLKYIRELTGLRELTLNDTAISDVGLECLRKLDQLMILRLAKTNITSEGMRHLNGFPRLENLYLNGTRVDDEGLRLLGNLPCLEVLTLNGTLVTDSGLIHLRGFRRLHKLYRGETKITNQGLRELLKDLPELIVIPPPDNEPHGRTVPAGTPSSGE